MHDWTDEFMGLSETDLEEAADYGHVYRFPHMVILQTGRIFEFYKKTGNRWWHAPVEQVWWHQGRWLKNNNGGYPTS